MKFTVGSDYQLCDVGSLECVFLGLILDLEAHRQSAVALVNHLVVVFDGLTEARDLATVNDQFRPRIFDRKPPPLHCFGERVVSSKSTQFVRSSLHSPASCRRS
ncbi:MAG: hypothetical protein ACREBO_08215 [Novosphingobium sp.]